MIITSLVFSCYFGYLVVRLWEWAGLMHETVPRTATYLIFSLGIPVLIYATSLMIAGPVFTVFVEGPIFIVAFLSAQVKLDKLEAGGGWKQLS